MNDLLKERKAQCANRCMHEAERRKNRKPGKRPRKKWKKKRRKDEKNKGKENRAKQEKNMEWTMEWTIENKGRRKEITTAWTKGQMKVRCFNSFPAFLYSRSRSLVRYRFTGQFPVQYRFYTGGWRRAIMWTYENLKEWRNENRWNEKIKNKGLKQSWNERFRKEGRKEGSMQKCKEWRETKD